MRAGLLKLFGVDCLGLLSIWVPRFGGSGLNGWPGILG